MRWWFALLVAGCSSPTTATPPRADASAPGPVVDVEPASPPEVACPGGKLATACRVAAEPCGDGGTLYECSVGECPDGPVGACEGSFTGEPGARIASVCCERRACVRYVALDLRCSRGATIADGGTVSAPRIGRTCAVGVPVPKGCVPHEPNSRDVCCGD